MKKYTTYKGLWAHKKSFHKNIQIKSNENEKTNEIKFNCNYCKRNFYDKYTVIRHEIKCNYKPVENIENLTKLKLELELTKELVTNHDKEIELINARNKELELRITLEKLLAEKCKMHPKTFSALNKILINKSINNINTNSNNTINNNYYNIIGFGHENLVDVLTQT